VIKTRNGISMVRKGRKFNDREDRTIIEVDKRRNKTATRTANLGNHFFLNPTFLLIQKAKMLPIPRTIHVPTKQTTTI
jgi:formylmethanofuran dehydrogenase subunit B